MQLHASCRWVVCLMDQKFKWVACSCQLNSMKSKYEMLDTMNLIAACAISTLANCSFDYYFYKMALQTPGQRFFAVAGPSVLGLDPMLPVDFELDMPSRLDSEY